jgi:hypothetical protein
MNYYPRKKRVVRRSLSAGGKAAGVGKQILSGVTSGKGIQMTQKVELTQKTVNDLIKIVAVLGSMYILGGEIRVKNWRNPM